ncbi:hypothetical protein ACSVBT_17480 [Afipia sp. TerB]
MKATLTGVAQLVRDALEPGVEVRPVDINLSEWDCTLEPTRGRYQAVRLGFCMVRSMNQKDAEQLVDRRTFGRILAMRLDNRIKSIEEVWRRAHLPVAMLRHIAAADGFAGLGLSRRDANWAIKALRDEALPLSGPMLLMVCTPATHRQSARSRPRRPIPGICRTGSPSAFDSWWSPFAQTSRTQLPATAAASWELRRR